MKFQFLYRLSREHLTNASLSLISWDIRRVFTVPYFFSLVELYYKTLVISAAGTKLWLGGKTEGIGVKNSWVQFPVPLLEKLL